MNVAVLGYGNIGGTLAKKWVAAGHRVYFGVRDPQKPAVQQLVQALGKNASAAILPEAIAAGEVVVFAIPGGAMEKTLAEPDFAGVPADMFYCGPEGEAKARVEGLIADVGLRPICLGGADKAGVVDDVLRLWVALVQGQKMSRKLAFRMLTK